MINLKIILKNWTASSLHSPHPVAQLTSTGCKVHPLILLKLLFISCQFYGSTSGDLISIPEPNLSAGLVTPCCSAAAPPTARCRATPSPSRTRRWWRGSPPGSGPTPRATPPASGSARTRWRAQTTPAPTGTTWVGASSRGGAGHTATLCRRVREGPGLGGAGPGPGAGQQGAPPPGGEGPLPGHLGAAGEHLVRGGRGLHHLQGLLGLRPARPPPAPLQILLQGQV